MSSTSSAVLGVGGLLFTCGDRKPMKARFAQWKCWGATDVAKKKLSYLSNGFLGIFLT